MPINHTNHTSLAHLEQVMPNLLARRNFNPVMTRHCLEMGYREAPDPKEPMAIVFVKVCASWD